jgi:hypothetical protein
MVGRGTTSLPGNERSGQPTESAANPLSKNASTGEALEAA